MTASPGEPLPSRCAVRVLDRGRGRAPLPRCLRRRDGDAARPLPPASRRGARAQAGELTFTYRFSFRNEPMLDLAERVAPRRARRPRVVLLQLVGLRGERVGAAPRGALLGASGPGRQGRVPLARHLVPRLDDGRALALGLALAGAVRAAAAQVRGRARTATRPRRARRRSRRPSSRGAPTTSPRSSSSPSPGRPAPPCRSPTATSRRCARCATGTTCSWSPTRSSPRSGAPAAGSRWSTTTPCLTSSPSGRASAAGSIPLSGMVASSRLRDVIEARRTASPTATRSRATRSDAPSAPR